MHLGGATDEHFSCFHSSCQLGLGFVPVGGNTAATVNPKYFGWINWDAA